MKKIEQLLTIKSAFVVGILTCLLLVTLIAFQTWLSSIAILLNLLLGITVTALLLVYFQQRMHIEQLATAEAERLVDSYIQSSGELFVELFRLSPVPYILINSNSEIVSANTAAVRLFNTTEEQLYGRDVFTQFSTEDTDTLDVLRQKFTTGISTREQEITLPRKGSKPSILLLSLFVVEDHELGRRGFVSLFDITKQKQIDTTKSEFVSLASHQLRTPIAAIKWSAELLEVGTEDPLSDVQKKYLARLKRSVQRMDQLVGDFLHASRLELGTFVPTLVSVSPQTILDEVLSELTPKILAKKLRVERWYEDGQPHLETDPQLLRIIFTNLLSNAVKYSRPEGTVKIHYWYNDVIFKCSIADTGIGIPADEQAQIFSKVFRASNAQVAEAEGTGLGLYIAREAATVMHGSIEFYSVANQGTTFTVALPV